MFTLPSMWNMVVSTIVFFIAAWYLHRYLEEQGLPKGMTRSLLVFMIASIASWGSGKVVDWIQGTQPVEQVTGDLSQILKIAGPVQQKSEVLQTPTNRRSGWADSRFCAVPLDRRVQIVARSAITI